jgi:allantoinase
VLGFKCFLVDSGVEDFPALDETGLRMAAEAVAAFGGLLLVHAEDPDLVRSAPPGNDYAGFAASRPPVAEVVAVEAVVAAARSTGCRVHVVHLAAAAALPVVRARRSWCRWPSTPRQPSSPPPSRSIRRPASSTANSWCCC